MTMQACHMQVNGDRDRSSRTGIENRHRYRSFGHMEKNRMEFGISIYWFSWARDQPCGVGLGIERSRWFPPFQKQGFCAFMCTSNSRTSIRIVV